MRPERVRSRQYDHSGGVVGLLSAEEIPKLRHLRDALNASFRPARAVSVRTGTQDIINATLAEQPHSIGKYYNAAGNKVFVVTDDGAGKIHLERYASASIVRQTIPWSGASLTNKKVEFVNINGVIVAVQQGGLLAPMFWSQTNAAETWLTCVLPVPDSTTLTLVASTHADGRMTALKTYYFRLRHRFANGSSKTSGTKSITLAGSENRVTVSTIPINPAGRTDYLGWTIERTKGNGDVNGPFYTLFDGTATSYVSDAADAGLGGIFERTVEANHGDPPLLDGVISHKGRLFGWRGSTVYLSQTIGDVEATGVFNWQADMSYDFDKDDGDEIQTAVIQSDRMVLFKRRSTHVIEGDDPDSFRVRRIADVGAAGYRAAAADGTTVYFLSGDRIIFRLAGDRAKPFGQVEAGHWLVDLDTTRISDAVVVNHIGDKMLFAAATSGYTYNSHCIEYDLLMNTWGRNDLRISDAVVQKDEAEFSRATLLYVDPVKVIPASGVSAASNPSFVSWAAGTSDTEALFQKLNSSGVGQWGAGVQASNSISLGTFPQYRPVMINDGSGGIIVAWIDRRAGNRYDVYVQRIDSAGAILWGAGGIAIAATGATTVNREYLNMIPDGQGGAIVAWQDSRLTPSPTLAVYVQRITSAGAIVWAANGVRVTSLTTNSEINPRLLSDGAAGSFVLFGEGTNLRIQRLSAAAGAAQMGTDGVVVQASSNNSGRMVTDGAGGVLVACAITSMNVRRYGPTGTLLWGPTSVSGSSNSYSTYQPQGFVGDGAGGAHVIWVAGSTDNNKKLLTNYISQAGTVLNVTPVTIDNPGATGYATEGQQQIRPRTVRCSDGDLIHVWAYGPADVSNTLKAIRLDSSLNALWTVTVRSSAVAGRPTEPVVVTDGADGVVVFWMDTRTDSNGDLYGQRVRSDGTVAWTVDGSALATGAAGQAYPYAIFTDAPEGEQPATRTANYHVWSAFKGSVDFADSSGQNGVPIHLMTEGHLVDDGHPDTLKDYERAELHIDGLTTADFTLTINFDEAADTVTLPLSAVLSGLARYDDNIAIYDDGVTKYLGSGRTELETGLPKGSISKRYSARIDADLEETLTITGRVVDARMLPDRPYSRS